MGLRTARRRAALPPRRRRGPHRPILTHMRDPTAVVFGALIGLLFAVLLSVPLAYLPGALGQFLPVISAGALAYLGAVIFSTRKKEIGELLQSSRRAPLVLPQQLLEGLQQRH